MTALLAELPVSPDPTVEVRRVSPEMARTWLMANTHNRPIHTTDVASYARDMERGDWQFTGDPIRRASDGTILDGQQRLLAIVRSCVTLRMVVVDDVPEDAQLVMDTGRRRSFGQTLALQGRKETNIIPAVTRLIIGWARGMPMHVNTAGITHSEMARFLAEHPDVYDSAELAGYVRRQIPIYSAVAGAAHYQCNRIDRITANDFFHKLATGTNLQDGDPVLTLRSRLAKSREENARLRAGEQLWLVVRTWNAHRRGEQLTKLQRPKGLTNSNFPSLV